MRAIYFILIFSIILKAENTEKKIYDALEVYAKILNHIEKSYYREINTEELIYTSIKKMVKSLDPHSEYLTEKEYKMFNGDLSGEKFGVGLEYEIKDEDVIITRVYRNSPSDKAGLKVGAIIEKINNIDVYGKSIEDIDKLIKGKISTTLKLMYFYKNKFKTVTLIRDRINIEEMEG